ncbi:hypothetical protein VTI74DRAFT_5768 [Chaetomium olivicolor]
MPPPISLPDDFPSPGRNPSPPSSSATSRPYAPRPTPSGARRLSSRRSLHEVPSSSSNQPKNFLTTVITTIKTLLHQSLRLYLALTPLKRVLLLLAATALFVLGVLFLVYSHRIFGLLSPLAASWRAHPAGWLPIWLATFATAFPPLIGYSTCVTLAGFVYGFPLGWPIAASATVAGSTAAFLTSRGVFAGYVQRLVGGDRRFVALGQVLRRDGIAVLVMIRLCPLPYSLSNGFLATVGSIRARVYAVATAASTPKLFVHVFIGSRIALLLESGDKMSGADRAINYASLAIGGLLGFTVGLLIYRRTMARAAELAREEGLEAGDALLSGDDDMEQGVLDGDLENGRMVDPDELDAAALMDDDDISLWDTAGGDGYHDSWDEEAAVGNGAANGAKK